MSNHLSLSERAYIEKCLVHDKSFAQIARDLHRSPSTIAREVLKYRVFVDKQYDKSSRSCVHYHSCTRHRLCYAI